MTYLLEEWKPVVGFEATHIVSISGRVVRIRTRYGNSQYKPLTLYKASTGYNSVELANGKNHRHYVHALVAAAFIGPRPEGHQINHKDGNKRNNRLSNLEYTTPHQNLAHAVATGLNTKANNFKLNPDLVRAIRRRHSEIGSYKLVGQEFGIDPTNIYRIVVRLQWKHVV